MLQESNPWRARIHDRFPDSPYPLLVFQEGIIPAASLWTGARLWVAAFRSAGLNAGDRVVLLLPPSAAFVQVLLAALWEGVTLAIAPPDTNADALIQELDARLAIASAPAEHVWPPDGCAGPLPPRARLRDAQGGATPDARFLLRTSGSEQKPRWVAMSDRNILCVLDSHLPLLDLSDARVLSVLPWHHAFGLVLDLMAGLLAGAEIVRDPCGGRSAPSMLRWMDDYQITHLSAVPLTLRRLAETDDGVHAIRQLRGGVVGGAPASHGLAEILQKTRLRAGYGQTEACPGITLGDPGSWAAGAMGSPLGCCAVCDQYGELHFQGDNACLGFWENGQLSRLDPDRWVATGDIVRSDSDCFTFVARRGDRFKLANGRWIDAGVWESALKRQFPQIAEALVYTEDGEHVTLLATFQEGASLPDRSTLSSRLGSIAHFIDQIVEIPDGAWIYQPKGSIDRRATAAKVRSLAPSS